MYIIKIIMNEATKKILGYTVPIGLFIALLVGVYYLMKNSPLFKALDGILDDAGKIAVAIEKMFDNCNKHGYFNVKEKCYIGLIGIVYVVLRSLAFMYSKYMSRNTGDSTVDDLADVKGESRVEIVIDITKGLDTDKLDGVDADVATAAIKIAINNKATKELLDKIDEQELSPENAAEAKANILAKAKTANDDAKSKLSEEQAEDADELASEMGSDPPPDF